MHKLLSNSKKLTFGIGPTGTGKTHLAIAAALNQTGVALYPITAPALTGVIAEKESDRHKNCNHRKILTISHEKTKRIEWVCDKLLQCLN